MIRVDLTKRTKEKKPGFTDFLKANGIYQHGEENAVAFKVILKNVSWGRDFDTKEDNTDKIQFVLETEDEKYRDYLTIYRFKKDGKWNGFATSQLTDINKMLGGEAFTGVSSVDLTPEMYVSSFEKPLAVTAYLDDYQGKEKINLNVSLADFLVVQEETPADGEASDGAQMSMDDML